MIGSNCFIGDEFIRKKNVSEGLTASEDINIGAFVCLNRQNNSVYLPNENSQDTDIYGIAKREDYHSDDTKILFAKKGTTINVLKLSMPVIIRPLVVNIDNSTYYDRKFVKIITYSTDISIPRGALLICKDENVPESIKYVKIKGNLFVK